MIWSFATDGWEEEVKAARRTARRPAPDERSAVNNARLIFPSAQTLFECFPVAAPRGSGPLMVAVSDTAAAGSTLDKVYCPRQCINQ